MPLNIDEFELILKKNKLFLKKTPQSLMMLQENTDTTSFSPPKQSTDSLVLQVNEFHHDLKVGQTFANWFEKCEDIFQNGLAHVPDNVKVRPLLRKLGVAENEGFEYVIHPRTISDPTFDETVSVISHFFD
ncbi:unnamed protein product [Hymenolepis diminuta]|uniref:DUF7083 domain-containing protein n=1 Tax=Hymenolepis diminuta TaxID=6216 RepID=A0A564YYE9_HYMDI|nr:unnamed protein product [Hymenolepis diminuta]